MNAERKLLVEAMLVASAALVSEGRVSAASSALAGPQSTSVVVSTIRPEFREALVPYGTWTTLAPYGEVWIPREMPMGWRPYTTGHWVYADEEGWTWIADEPWGWLPFHYGRWVQDVSQGWTWIPGDVWAPAWVAWRQSDDVAGWAPLPPSAGWTVGVGLALDKVDLDVAIGDGAWSFVPVAGLCHPHVCDVILLREQTLVHRIPLVRTNLVVEHGLPVHRPLAPELVERAGGGAVPHVVVYTVDREDVLHGSAFGPNEVAIFRPAPTGPGAGLMRTPASEPTSAAHASVVAAAPHAPAAARVSRPPEKHVVVVPAAPEAKAKDTHKPASDTTQHSTHRRKQHKSA